MSTAGAAAALFPGALRRLPQRCHPLALSASPLSSVALHRRFLVSPLLAPSNPPKHESLLLLACSDASDAKVGSEGEASKSSVLLSLVQEIEPLDVSIIQKDVPADTVDAMKRTISGMLGLLPSKQFNVRVTSLWQEFFRVLVSSIITGYAMHNAEYRLCLERNLDIQGEQTEKEQTSTLEHETSNPSREDLIGNHDKDGRKLVHESMSSECGGKMSPKSKEYIQHLQARLNSVKKDLQHVKRKISALKTRQLVENNDILDYLRSLQPEKVSELSEPTCPGVVETINSIVHGLLATLSPNMFTYPESLHSQNAASETLHRGEDDCAAELVEDTTIQFQPAISVPRDYLARLLFWCMLLGHYLRGHECRLELAHILRISSNGETISYDT